MGVETELFGIKNRGDGKEFRVVEKADGSIAVYAGDVALIEPGKIPVTATPSAQGIRLPSVEGVTVSGTRPTMGQQIAAAFYGSPIHDELMTILGDSTGNETDEWAYLYSTRLAAALPADVRVEYRLYDDTANRYGQVIVFKEGAGESGVTIGSDLRGWAFMGGDVGAVGPDLDAWVDCSLIAWSGVTEQVLVSQYGASGSRVFRLYVNTAGNIGLEWKTDGTNGPSAVLSSVSSGIAAGSRKRVRATLDVDNGASGYDAKFWLSDDGLTWTQLGTTITGAGVTSLFQTTSQVYEIGSRGGSASAAGANAGAQGTFYSAHVSGVIDGGNKLPVFLRSAQDYNNMSGTRIGGPLLRICNGSIPGSNMTYQLTAPRFERMVPRHLGTASVILSSLHNEDVAYAPATYITRLQGFKAAIETRIGALRYAICTQNPQFSPRSAVQIYGQAGRARLAASLGRQWGWDVIDTFPAFTDASMVQADGVHPAKATGCIAQAEIAWATCGI